MAEIIFIIKIISILAHAVCLGVVGYKLVGDTQIGRFALVALIAAVFFFVEHFIGFGRPPHIWILTTPVTILLVVKCKSLQQRVSSGSELPFLFGFIVALLWRSIFPDITARTEALTDLYFISNYLSGETLPPPDMWYANDFFNFYYSFMQYSAALVGRFFDLSPGQTYNLAWCVYLGLLVSLAWSFTESMALSRLQRSIVIAILVWGGNGATPLMPLMLNHDLPHTVENERYSEQAAKVNLFSSIRWVGGMEKLANTPLAASLYGVDTPPELTPEEVHGAISTELEDGSLLLAAYPAFYMYSGDFHSSLAGFLFAVFALAIAAKLKNEQSTSRARILTALLASTGPLVLVSNAWAVPMHTLLVFALLAEHVWRKKEFFWRSFLTGGLATLFLIVPFLLSFTEEPSQISIRRVLPQHENPWRTIIYFWPLFIVFAVALKNRTQIAMTLCIAGVCAVIFLISSEFYLADQTRPYYTRFNTTLKMWEWILAVGTVYGFAAALGAPGRLAKSVTVITGSLLLFFLVELSIYTVAVDKSSFLHLSGHHWFTKNSHDHELLKSLESLPSGRVLERNLGPAYNPTSRFSLFSGKPVVIGWPGHVRIWRNHPETVTTMLYMSEQLYAGQLSTADADAWLDEHEVDYVVWSSAERELGQETFLKVKEVLSLSFSWFPVSEDTESPAGLWIRK